MLVHRVSTGTRAVDTVLQTVPVHVQALPRLLQRDCVLYQLHGAVQDDVQSVEVASQGGAMRVQDFRHVLPMIWQEFHSLEHVGRSSTLHLATHCAEP